ncbi:LPS export ABC transporter periplasmic protein LptC [Orenia marismortui]|uniref:LPS export ABC transporter periplasmic protein LptC n=1 Tax=Orenia marismortui TaxID=46469 RepID=UPI00035CE730|nr:LPS export ABC transporter periplasmic protein LptC [Orenia marismortui]
MNKSKILLVGISILIISGLCFLYFSGDESTTKEIPNYQYQIDDSRVVTYDAGDKRWDITALEILVPKSEEEKSKKVILSDIQKGQLFKNNKAKYDLDAEKIIYFKEKKDITLKGNIKLKEISGEEIETEELDWIDKRKEFVSKADVNVKFKDGNLFAKKMRMDVENNIIDFSGEVEMEFDLKGDGNDEK